MIFKVNENGTVGRVSISAAYESEQDFIDKNVGKGYVYQESDIEGAFLKVDENGAIVADTDKQTEYEKLAVNAKAKAILSATDYIMLIDNPLGLSAEDITAVYEYRAALRATTGTTLPTAPVCIDGKF